MPSALAGLHHVTTIATDPQRNVKTTVNFDAPDTYHLHFGNETGQPGTLITFFPWPGAEQGRRGTGKATTVAFRSRRGSLGWWQAHLVNLAIHTGPVTTRPGEETLSVRDSDGLALELVAHPQADPRPPWPDGPIPPEHAIRGLHWFRRLAAASTAGANSTRGKGIACRLAQHPLRAAAPVSPCAG